MEDHEEDFRGKRGRLPGDLILGFMAQFLGSGRMALRLPLPVATSRVIGAHFLCIGVPYRRHHTKLPAVMHL